MARIEWKGLEAYQDKLHELTIGTAKLCKAAVYEGAAVVVEAVKAKCPTDSGDLRDSVGLSEMRNDNGFINTKLGFDGYDSKGVPNVVKARVIESGASNHKKNPFVRLAVNGCKEQAKAAMAKKFDDAVNEIMK